jgi:SpoVK/Ycf46/Vps4 family AAA+-type ATPase
MNAKAKLYLSLYKKILYPKPDVGDTQAANKIGEVQDNCCQSIGNVFIEIAAAYIRETGDDESEYWYSFVFDLATAAGYHVNNATSATSDEAKRQYVRNEARVIDGSDCKKTDLKDTIAGIRAFVLTFSIAEREQVTKAILTYAYNLVTLDRRISTCEYKFFGELENAFLRGDSQSEPMSTTTKQQRNDVNRTNEAKGNVKDILCEIDKLIGLKSIKTEVRSIINMIQVQQLRKEKGLKQLDVSNHMVFYGNPGTGKTTIARRLGDVYRILGLLSKGHFIETDRSGLVAGYLGQTALKTTEVLNSALGGILFIDEAYSLAKEDGQDQYGQEAIDTILKYMEDHRDDLVIIVAGYKDLMLRFLDSNPGLKSRFNKYLDFPDYSDQELAVIFSSMVTDSHYRMTNDASEHLSNLCRELVDIRTENFGNGRAMRNLFEKTIANQANRIVSSGSLNEQELQIIEKHDILRDDILSVR